MGTMKDYRKAYYKMGTRNKVSVTMEPPNPDIAKFLFQKSHEDYVEMFGGTVEPLIKQTSNKKLFGVIRQGNRIKAIFLMDGSGKLIGDLNNVPLSRENVSLINLYGVNLQI